MSASPPESIIVVERQRLSPMQVLAIVFTLTLLFVTVTIALALAVGAQLLQSEVSRNIVSYGLVVSLIVFASLSIGATVVMALVGRNQVWNMKSLG